VHDLHTAASVWLGARADHKVVQRVLGGAAYRVEPMTYALGKAREHATAPLPA
jgi:hypothetical protein